jgi:hypothetical protein
VIVFVLLAQRVELRFQASGALVFFAVRSRRETTGKNLSSHAAVLRDAL